MLFLCAFSSINLSTFLNNHGLIRIENRENIGFKCKKYTKLHLSLISAFQKLNKLLKSIL
ncbi:hypothetical protein ACIN8IBEIGE_50399 [Acinetobacter sp. 8I-beige]|nr:hypothetical protein ACIN8IBEIGE_50399 [Acinetobacter sp. 8I-beige]